MRAEEAETMVSVSDLGGKGSYNEGKDTVKVVGD